MAEVAIEIGGRVYEVACQEGEEHFLQSAAAQLDGEARTLIEQIGRLPEARMLLMAGLMLSDKTAGYADELARLRAELEEARARITELEASPTPEPDRIEVPVIPESLKESLAEIAARSEALAEQVEEKAAS
ncbi:MAG: cell division protein ZapA [Brevirhabdus sp.]